MTFIACIALTRSTGISTTFRLCHDRLCRGCIGGRLIFIIDSRFKIHGATNQSSLDPRRQMARSWPSWTSFTIVVQVCSDCFRVGLPLSWEFSRGSSQSPENSICLSLVASTCLGREIFFHELRDKRRLSVWFSDEKFRHWCSGPTRS